VDPSGSARRSVRPTRRRGRRWEGRAWGAWRSLNTRSVRVPSLFPLGRFLFARRRKNLFALLVADRDGPVWAALRGLQDRLVRRACRIDQLDLLVVAEDEDSGRSGNTIAEGLALLLADLDAHGCHCFISDQELQQRHFLVTVD